MGALPILSERFKSKTLSLHAAGWCCIALTVFGTPAAVWARESREVKGFIGRFEASNRATRSLRAHFVQVYTAAGGRRTESGTVTLAPGGRMRWRYVQPQKKLFVADGKQVTLYIPAEQQATISNEKTSGDVRQAFSLLIGGRNPSRLFAQIEFDDNALSHPAGDRVLRAIPKNPNRAGFTQALVEIGPRFDVRRLVITYDNGSKMEFSFSNVERNSPVSPNAFRLNPPPGTEIIRQP